MNNSENIDLDLLSDFIAEGSEIIADVENKLIELEKNPGDADLLNSIFRGFHTIKGGAGFVGAGGMVAICHKTENLFDKLRSLELALNSEMMDAILDATKMIASQFSELAPPNIKISQASDHIGLCDRLETFLSGRASLPKQSNASAPPNNKTPSNLPSIEEKVDALYPLALQAFSGSKEATDAASNSSVEVAAVDARAHPVHAPVQNKASDHSQHKETSIRVETSRLDDVLNLSGEIGLTKNRLTTLRSELLSGRRDAKTLKALDQAVSQMDLLIGDLQNAVMKTRMQPIGRLFQKYPRVVRDLARQLGKKVDLVLDGEDKELDKTMVDDLGDPLLHLIRNALDHGLEDPETRIAAGKSPTGTVSLSARQVGDHIYIEVKDDGRGIKPEVIRKKAIEKGLIGADYANGLDDRQSLGLIFLPGFSTSAEISSISGRGVGMDVVKTNIQKLNGQVEIHSVPGEGSSFLISLPLTLAILSVLVVSTSGQSFAIPLSTVREILTILPSDIQEIGGKKAVVVRDEILIVKSLSHLLGMPSEDKCRYGVVVRWGDQSFILSVDEFIGRDDVVIKPLLDVKPTGIAGATLSGDGEIVMIIDFKELLGERQDLIFF